MRQSRLMSLVEAAANLAVGYGVAVLTQCLVFPLFGLQASLRENLMIGAVFIAVSIIRSYTLGGSSRRCGLGAGEEPKASTFSEVMLARPLAAS